MVVLFANDGERGLIVDGREGGVVPCVSGHRTGGVLGAAEDANGRGAEAALRRYHSVPLAHHSIEACLAPSAYRLPVDPLLEEGKHLPSHPLHQHLPIRLCPNCIEVGRSYLLAFSARK